MMQTTDHTLSGSSMTHVQMEALLDILADECVRLDSECASMRVALTSTEQRVTRTREIIGTVRQQVEAGKLSVESAVAFLSGPPPAATPKHIDSHGLAERISDRRRTA